MKTRYEIESEVSEIEKQVADDYEVPEDYYGDCHCDEILHLENRAELCRSEEEYEECMSEIKEIFEYYARSYQSFEEDE